MADFSEFLVNAEITVRSYDTEFSKLDQAKMIASDIIQELHNCRHLPEHTVITVSWFPEDGDKECKICKFSDIVPKEESQKNE